MDKHTPPTDGNPIEATGAVIEQLAAVRESGLVNMMDFRGVGEVADAIGHDDLAVFCGALGAIRNVRERGTIWMAVLEAMVVSR